MILEGGERIFKEWAREMGPIAPAEIEYGRSNRKSDFLDVFGRLWSMCSILCCTFLTLASSKQSVGSPIAWLSEGLDRGFIHPPQIP